MPVPEHIQIKQLDLELNGGCNYACPMCPQAEGREKEFLKKLPYKVFTKIVDDAVQYGLDTVSLHGSGEPTLNKDFPDYVRYIREKGLRCLSFTNGYRLTEDMSRRLIDARLNVLRISCNGYDRESYAHWMSQDAFHRVRDNVKRFVELNSELGGETEAHLYHLITDLKQMDYEIEQYRRNWVDYTGAFSEIWLMHNWAGQDGVEIGYTREMVKPLGAKRSCGRPFSPLLQVRAGGLEGHSAAVVACCMVLGKDSQGVLGHLDTESIAEVIGGGAYSNLRAAHREGRFDEIPYCKGCDQLYDVPESLVWTNIPGRLYGQSKVVADVDHRKFTEVAAE